LLITIEDTTAEQPEEDKMLCSIIHSTIVTAEVEHISAETISLL